MDTTPLGPLLHEAVSRDRSGGTRGPPLCPADLAAAVSRHSGLPYHPAHQRVTPRTTGTGPRPEADGLRRMLLEAEALKALHKVSAAALNDLRCIQLAFIESWPGPQPPRTPVKTKKVSGDEYTVAQHSGGSGRHKHAQEVDLVSIAKGVQNALKSSDSVCAAKIDSVAPPSTTAADLSRLARWVVKAWREKKGSILDELLENLDAPQGVDKGKLLAMAADQLYQERHHHYPGYSPVEMLVMALYTMAGPDIDTLMGFPDVPNYDTERTAWDAYCKEHSSDRNPAMFSEINSSMRALGGHPPPPPDHEAWGKVRRWVKSLVLLTTLASRGGDAPTTNLVLSRGLAGLPANVVSTHKNLKCGEALRWPAPSSCAMDPAVSESYIRGTAANAVKQTGGAVLFSIKNVRCGLPLQKISKYPKEAEVLLPPLLEFKILGVQTCEPGERLPDGTVVVKANCSGKIPECMKNVCTEALAEARKASQLLQELLEPVCVKCETHGSHTTYQCHLTSVPTLFHPTGASFSHSVSPTGPLGSPSPRKSRRLPVPLPRYSTLLLPTRCWENKLAAAIAARSPSGSPTD
eukprot:Sspe_Gene.82753::Locus_54246_Transcript_1_2_Confidence_0.600_Length_1984::g.82753::m.82753